MAKQEHKQQGEAKNITMHQECMSVASSNTLEWIEANEVMNQQHDEVMRLERSEMNQAMRHEEKAEQWNNHELVMNSLKCKAYQKGRTVMIHA